MQGITFQHLLQVFNAISACPRTRFDALLASTSELGIGGVIGQANGVMVWRYHSAMLKTLKEKSINLPASIMRHYITFILFGVIRKCRMGKIQGRQMMDTLRLSHWIFFFRRSQRCYTSPFCFRPRMPSPTRPQWSWPEHKWLLLV